MRIDDERLESLGTYFVHFDVATRYGISFEQFLRKVLNGTWTAYLSS